jgi:hypothetical protein
MVTMVSGGAYPYDHFSPMGTSLRGYLGYGPLRVKFLRVLKSEHGRPK